MEKRKAEVIVRLKFWAGGVNWSQTPVHRYNLPAAPASPIASDYPLNEWRMGTIGGVWQESTPSKETTGPAQTRNAKGYETEQSEMPNGARAAFAWAHGL